MAGLTPAAMARRVNDASGGTEDYCNARVNNGGGARHIRISSDNQPKVSI